MLTNQPRLHQDIPQYQYGVPMKVSRFCLFLVVMADTPKSAGGERKRKERQREEMKRI